MGAAAIKAPCDRTYHASRSSGVRDPKIIRWIVMHSEEAKTAESAAQWFANPADPPQGPAGSAHLCVDDVICYRTLRDTEIPWAAKGANTAGFHIEQAGFARWGAIEWLRHRNTLKRAAYKAALHCDLFDIPPVFITAAGLKANEPGITTHAECTKAWGGSHTDPGMFWPRKYFMSLVRGYLAELADYTP